MGNMFYGAGPLIFKRAEELRKNQTADEKLLWLYLKRNKLGVRFKRQHPIWMYIADFYSHELKLVIEVDGAVHNLKEVMENDIIRQEDIISLGIRVMRFTNLEVRTDIDGVTKKIEAVIHEIRSIQENDQKSN
ncbi:MAG: endonuclease domain-containing protein [Chitinophagaceae bacterium]